VNTEDRDKQRRKELILRAVQDQLDSPETPEVKCIMSVCGHSDAAMQRLGS